MKLFRIDFDSQQYFIEAATMQYAIMIWKLHVEKLWGKDYDGTEEPESCALIHDEPVIRELFKPLLWRWRHANDG